MCDAQHIYQGHIYIVLNREMRCGCPEPSGPRRSSITDENTHTPPLGTHTHTLTHTQSAIRICENDENKHKQRGEVKQSYVERSAMRCPRVDDCRLTHTHTRPTWHGPDPDLNACRIHKGVLNTNTSCTHTHTHMLIHTKHKTTQFAGEECVRDDCRQGGGSPCITWITHAFCFYSNPYRELQPY